MSAPPSTTETLRLIGIAPEAASAVIEEWIHRRPAPLWIVVAPDDERAALLREDLTFFSRFARTGTGPAIHHLPTGGGDLRGPEALEREGDRLSLLHLLRPEESDGPLVLVTGPEALAAPVPPPAGLSAAERRLLPGQAVGLRDLVAWLHKVDYDEESLCEAPGQFAVRGGLLDLYPITADQPFRLDFFGDTLESIRAFDPVTQRSAGAVESLLVPAIPKPSDAAGGTLADHLPDRVHWLILEEDGEPPPLPPALAEDRNGRPDIWIRLSELDLGEDDAGPEPLLYEAESLAAYRSFPDESSLADERLIGEHTARTRFLADLEQWRRAGHRLFIVVSREGEEGRIAEILKEAGHSDLDPHWLHGPLTNGFRIQFRKTTERLSWPGLDGAPGLVVVTQTELFGRQRQRRAAVRARARAARSQIDHLLDFSELVEGEFVVHLQHGIALYRGLQTIDLRGEKREVLTLEFDAGVLLHVPLQESHLISRYVGLSKVRPQLGRVGGGRWEKTRQAAERATLDLAAQLLEIQARRDTEQGIAFPADTPWQQEFEASFPFKETPDQHSAILASKGDMERPRPMDRLVCGDVGFGKTEVALRAAFKAVLGGHQVALLAPTTVLAQQHFNTFTERMAGYPVTIEMLSRFRSPRQQKQIAAAVREGKVDIIIGTHRIIQKDIAFPRLGLVVIDEEQRFGVRHKERFKEWRSTVDLLSLSATPIPRTLYLALTGARDLSVIETPPAERRPIETFVRGYDEKLVREVILREIRRGGQVFYLHNRVQTIDAVADRLRHLLPDVSFGVGHGQMDEKNLERVMTDFVAGRYQVLVCTTIIESGLDIPNCNTIIIEGADRFGLSQLYQLRGRVGRFRRQAYAYLLLHRGARILDLARKRLAALRQHNQLGAGFRIAMRDLELRGAGNLLGAEQSGHIVGVGFELYCQLLRQSIARLKGEPAARTIRALVKLDFVYQGEGVGEERRRYEDGFTVLRDAEIGRSACPPIEARIPHTFLPDTRLRIDLYRRLAMAENRAAVRELEAAIRDRFGPPPDEVKALLLLAEIRTLAEQKNLLSVEAEGARLKCLRNSRSRDDFVMPGSRFPRLTAPKPLLRLKEVRTFLHNLPDPNT
ncbi:MAG: transcription-repair coupling factor [Puniceicoccaceae bacterium]|nr:MAG: transcription-repair coupling factor [Puniceicoccaceae bacterium]